MNSIFSTARLFLAASLLFSTSAISAFAGADDYQFQPVATELPVGPASELAVKLVDKRTGKPVADAVIFETRLDMAPDGMEMMTSPVEVVPASEPGIYKFKLNLSMEGGWRFQVAAKVQGEQDTAKGEVVLKATQ